MTANTLVPERMELNNQLAETTATESRISQRIARRQTAMVDPKAPIGGRSAGNAMRSIFLALAVTPAIHSYADVANQCPPKDLSDHYIQGEVAATPDRQMQRSAAAGGHTYLMYAEERADYILPTTLPGGVYEVLIDTTNDHDSAHPLETLELHVNNELISTTTAQDSGDTGGGYDWNVVKRYPLGVTSLEPGDVMSVVVSGGDIIEFDQFILVPAQYTAASVPVAFDSFEAVGSNAAFATDGDLSTALSARDERHCNGSSCDLSVGATASYTGLFSSPTVLNEIRFASQSYGATDTHSSGNQGTVYDIKVEILVDSDWIVVYHDGTSSPQSGLRVVPACPVTETSLTGEWLNVHGIRVSASTTGTSDHDIVGAAYVHEVSAWTNVVKCPPDPRLSRGILSYSATGRVSKTLTLTSDFHLAEESSVLILGLGPSLPHVRPLRNPVLELLAEDGTSLARNDDWDRTIEYPYPPGHKKESALALRLEPGIYRVVLSRKRGKIGIGSIAVFVLD